MSDEKTHENGVCMSCGGKVDAHGMAEGGEVEGGEVEGEAGSPMPAANDQNPAEDDDNVRAFVAALRGKK